MTQDHDRFVAAVTTEATDAQDAERIARAMYGWPGDRVAVAELPDGLWHVTLHRDDTATIETTDGVYEYAAYPLPGDPEPATCRHCGRDTIPVFGAWMSDDGRFRCASDWTDHAPMIASAAR